jgi:hypothetical protein
MDRKTSGAGWFGPKRFGFGIGPASWQGWLVILAFVAGAVGSAKGFEGQPHLQFGSLAGLLAALAVTIFATYRRV